MESLQTVSVIEQALERTNGNRVLAELLVKVTRNFVTPVDDPLYDWRIKRLSEINEQVRTTTADGLTWRRVPDTVECRTSRHLPISAPWRGGIGWYRATPCRPRLPC